MGGGRWEGAAQVVICAVAVVCIPPQVRAATCGIVNQAYRYAGEVEAFRARSRLVQKKERDASTT